MEELKVIAKKICADRQSYVDQIKTAIQMISTIQQELCSLQAETTNLSK